MKKKNFGKRGISLLLAAVLMASAAACGKTPEQETAQVPASQAPGASSGYTREDKELIAQLMGGESDPENMSDTQLDALVEELTQELSQQQTAGIVDLNSSQADIPSVDTNQNPDAYDESGAMTKPFDQVYPELIEAGQVSFSGESLLIKLKSDALTDGLRAAGIGALERVVPLEGAAWYKARLTEGTDPTSALEAVRKLDEVLLAEYDYEVKTAALDEYKHFDKDMDEDFKKNGHNKDQWHFHHCGIVDGYEKMDTQGGDPSVVVAVIDSGVDYDHEDLADNMWVNADEIPDNGRDDDNNGYIDDYYGVDILAGKGSGDDTNGHGTHVAGIIAARNNNTGVLGIAYNVKIMSVKAAAHNGTLTQSDIAKAVLYAYENGAEVINMSFGSAASSIAVQDALATAYTRCVLVASAGNNGMSNHTAPNYPAALTYVLGVMSVDQYGVESAFTNYDAVAFNGLEYELYAPGENIMSTLPENQYGFLSGTSMAAPVVSAFAAILRSEFTDRDKYPTKFIYGQLAATSGICADCVNPRDHGPHNLPQVADLNAALTKLPKPEVNVQDYALFDDPKYSDKNNGDGVIDAGETIALGLTLRNRWGMSENTLVSLDTVSQSSGLSDPYITIQNPTVDYGSVGTYSTQDAGRIYTDELLTGWEKPFLITVSEDCPNDYRFTLNVTVTCENALDEADKTVYRSEGTVDENVRSGYILPSVIDQDMVLTPDNLYIIPRATVIKEGVTVRVEPGTHIQFWSDDADDPYADDYIAYLVVNGTFLAEGTKEDPVYIYPSDLMYRYAVDIGASSTGYVSLKYTDLTNFTPINSQRVDVADHCTFRQSYHTLYYRYVSNGSVGWSSRSTQLNIKTATDCVFYKLIGSHRGYSDRCIFSHSEISFNGNYQNCVFLGNRWIDLSAPNASNQSTLTLSVPEDTAANTPEIFSSYNENTGTTYIVASISQGVTYEYLKQILGKEEIPYAVIETAEELEWMRMGLLVPSTPTGSAAPIDVGIRYDRTAKCHVWSDGSAVGSFLYWGSPEPSELYLHRNEQGLYSSLYLSTPQCSVDYALYEIPGQILPREITFCEYVTYMDMDTTYQLLPRSKPAQLSLDSFLYESSDESVVTVSETGLVTPVGKGTADVWVYSSDRTVKNYVTVTVGDPVALEGLAFPDDTALLYQGQVLPADILLTPENTTRRNVVYASSDEGVVTVDASGMLTAVRSGTATVTATCEGLTTTLQVTVYQKATSLTLSQSVVSVKLSDAIVSTPLVITDPGAEPDLVWRSTDESVATVEDGDMILKKLGTTTIEVTDRRSGLSASCLVIVQEQEQIGIRDMQAGTYSHWVLLDNGDLYFWDSSLSITPMLADQNVATFYACGTEILIAREDGTLEHKYMYDADDFFTRKQWPDFVGREILGVAMYQNGPTGYFVYTADGCTYAMGDINTEGALGLDSSFGADTWELVMLEDVVDIVTCAQVTTFFLTKSGDLYYAGGHNDTTVPTKMAERVAQIFPTSSSERIWVASGTNYLQELSTDGTVCEQDYAWQSSTKVYTQGSRVIGIRDGVVYTDVIGQWSEDDLRVVPNIQDAVNIWSTNYDHTVYILTAQNLLYGYGENPGSENHFAGVTTEHPVETPVLIPMTPLADETASVTGSNIQNGVLAEDTIALTFNKELLNASAKLYADGTQVVANVTVDRLNHVTVNRSAGFSEGVNYELVFPAGCLSAQGNITNEEIRIAFTRGTLEDIAPEEPLPEDPNASDTTDKEDGDIGIPFALRSSDEIHESVFDPTLRPSLEEQLSQLHTQQQLNGQFFHNAVLNPISTDTEVTHWLRLQAPQITAGTYQELPLGGNWWGSTNETAIGLQLIDYTDYPNYARLQYAPYLTGAPENTFPFVTAVTLLNKEGEAVTTVGNEKITFRVRFNRDMDTSIPLQVRFGSAYPYGDYEIQGSYVDARTWEGVYTLSTVIENGYQYFTVANGCSATGDLPLQTDQARFFFEIDTTAAQALIMQGSATDTGIQLKWTQDDFATLMGYNVYRSTSLNGQYTRLNKTVIPADTMQWFDDTVEPGQVYYYNFTVVQTDLTESIPSGKISLMSKDTMAPNIYHSPVTSATTGHNLVISATVTDNLNIIYANLYYRITGTDTWKTVRMNALNDKFSAILPATDITLEGVEYYLEAFDGVSFTYRGSADAPFAIAVRQALDANALGDSDGDGAVTVRDALMVLQAITHKYNMTEEEFARSDLNGDGQLSAVEALRILHYVSGTVGSLAM